jgi:hypothetical protein
MRISVRGCFALAAIFGGLSSGSLLAQVPEAGLGSRDGMWRPVDRPAVEAALAPGDEGAGARRGPDAGRLFKLNREALQGALGRAPLESRQAARRGVEAAAADPLPAPPEISLPLPNLTYQRFQVEESPILSPKLAAKYPEIRTYQARGIDDPEASARLSLTPSGFRAQVLSPRGTFYVDPTGNDEEYTSYFRQDLRRGPGQCEVQGDPGEARREAARPPSRTGQSLRTYRIAVACTGEYAAFHGGTVARALDGIAATINRVSGIFQQELAIRLILVDDNDQLVFTNSGSDGLDNNNARTLINQSQAKIDDLIKDANYDIGHTFSTGAGGLAGLGVVCRGGQKGRGVTGQSSPFGDGFDVDFVAHEIGHQFGGNHTFNGASGSCSGGNRNGPTAYEPGSGSTIMAYAGICRGDDLQPHSNAYFHCESLDEITDYVTLGAGNAAFETDPSGNTPPTVSAGGDVAIPHGTPFLLSAQGSDADGDRLTYCWEERDLGPQAAADAPDDGRIPLFRSIAPASDPSRTFPRLSDILGGVATLGERLPGRERTMVFRVTARDNRPGGGGTGADEVKVRVVAGAGPFRVTEPAASGTLSGRVLVKWSVANTDAAPVSVGRVNIKLSTDGGQTFPLTLAADTPNDGSQEVDLPSLTTGTAPHQGRGQ